MGAAFGCLILLGPKLLNDPDTQWHVTIGSRILGEMSFPLRDTDSHTFADAPWIAKEWLSQLLLAVAHRAAGWTGVVALTAGTIALTFALLCRWLLARLKWTLALSIVLAIFALVGGHFLARPLVFAFPLLVVAAAAAVDAAEQGAAPPLWLAALMLLWANLHPSFPIAFVVLAAMAGEAVWFGRAGERARLARAWFLVGGLCVAATLVTPYGPRPFLIAIGFMQSNEAIAYTTEWQPVALRLDLWVVSAALTLATVLGCLALDPRRSPFRILLVLVLAWLTIRHVRFAVFFGFVSALMVADPLRRLLPELGPRRLWRSAVLTGAALSAAIILAGALVQAKDPPAPPARITPERALAEALRAGVRGPVYNDWSFGGMLIAHGVKTFIDGRNDQLFGGGFMTRLYAALDQPEPAAFLAMLSDYGVEWALVEARGQADAKLARAAGWDQIYRDDDAAVYRRRD